MNNIKDIVDNCLECDMCLNQCNMLKEYGKNPKNLFKSILNKEDKYLKVPYYCNLCTRCESVCAKDLKISKAFMEVRLENSKENRGKSPLKGHKSIQMHQNLSFSNKFSGVILPKGEKSVEKVFMPGCSLCAYNPELVFKTYEYLNNKFNGCGLIIGCCGKPTLSIGEEDKFKRSYGKLQHMIDLTGAKEVITACQSCFLTIKDKSPDIKVSSLWNVLNEIGIPEKSLNIGKDSDILFTIHDSCPTRYEWKLQDSIRNIVKKLGYDFCEMEFSREKTRCCGAGGMVPSVNKELSIKNMKTTASGAKSDYIITYCASCRQSMASAGKKSLHLLDLIFLGKWSGKSKIPTTIGTLKSWSNRLKIAGKLKNL